MVSPEVENVIDFSIIAVIHVGAAFAPFYFTRNAFLTFVFLHFVTGCLGITTTYHRLLTHRSFTVPRWVEYIGAYAGVLAVQGDPAEWVTTHRTHHIHSDKAGDPHSPCEGFGWGHIGWIFDNRALHKRLRDGAGAADLREQAYYRFLADTNFAHVLGSAYLLFLAGGWPVFLWGFCFRAVFGWHATFAINSACHTWGNRPFRTTDHSRNLWWVALFTFGEGWHNNHHAFSYSARHGLEWWQLDATWGVVRALELVGLATNVKVPKREQMDKLRQTHQPATTTAAATAAAVGCSAAAACQPATGCQPPAAAGFLPVAGG